MPINVSISELFDEVDDGVALVGPDLRILHANRAFAAMTGTADLIGQSCHKVVMGLEGPCFKDSLLCPVRAAIEKGEPSSRAMARQEGDESRMLVIKAYPIRTSSDAPPTAAIIVVTDDTERISAGRQLLHAQKMQAIGSLAGGIAHYFKNVLTSINSYSELIMGEAHKSPEAAQYARIICRAANKASDAVTGLLDFTRIDEIDGEPVDINAVLRDAVQMIANLIPKAIELDISLDEALAHVEGSAGQIEQAAVNLLINARDAMPDGGTLGVSTSMAHITKKTSGQNAFIVPGRYVLIAVSDTGCGISPEDMQRVFQPFYTTKPVGEGTGLGLAMTYRIAKRHHGYVTVQSTKGRGSTFTIHLPVKQGILRPVGDGDKN